MCDESKGESFSRDGAGVPWTAQGSLFLWAALPLALWLGDRGCLLMWRYSLMN